MASLPAQVSAATCMSQWSVVESLQGVAGASGGTVTSTALNPGQQAYSQTGSPPVKYYWSKTIALVAAAATIDLTALAGGLQGDIDASGLKVQRCRFRSVSVGNSAFTISPGAANPYPLFGAANDMVIAAGNTEVLEMGFNGTLADVAAGAKQIDIAGTGTEQIHCELLLG